MHDLSFRRIVKKIFLLFILSLFSSNLQSQVTQLRPINVTEGLNNGYIHAAVDPSSTGITEKIFDSNPYTGDIVQNSDTAIITLSFDNPVKIAKAKVFFWNNGEWDLEAANSEDDLNNKTGSYQSLVNNDAYTSFAWDSVSFSPIEPTLIRLTARNLQDSYVYMGEWVLYTPFTLTSLVILPDPVKLLPETSLQLKAKPVDDNGDVYPCNLDEPIYWASNDRSIATIDEFGIITGASVGTTVITATTTSLSGTTTASVEEDFQSTKAKTMTIKVALVLQNPVIDSTNMRRIHQVRGWTNPLSLVNQIIEEFTQMSGGVIQFQIVETHDDEGIFSRLSGELMTIDTLAYYYSSISRVYGRDVDGTLQNLAEVQGKIKFDYNAMIDYYDLHTKRNNGEIDEIWVYAHPFAGMYESQLVGPNAFWWNSPPLDHPGLEKLLSIMGWNYERGVAEALHSVGHRAESAIRHAYGRWDCKNENPNSWELFTRIDKDVPGKAHIGNIHFPPNGMSDYDYGNRRYVSTHADNWKRYPILLNEQRTVNCQEWRCTHLGYMRWWFNHLPRYTGVTDGILNNWWHYVVDYEGAVEEAMRHTSVDDKNGYSNIVRCKYSLEQNYPNPFNPLTQIRFSLAAPQHVTIKVYDVLGREVKTIIDDWEPIGQHEVKLDGADLASGIYFYGIRAGTFNEAKKLLLLR